MAHETARPPATKVHLRWVNKPQRTDSCMRTFAGHRGEVNTCAISPDETLIVSGGGDCTLVVWDATTGAEMHRLRGHQDSITSCAFSADGMQLVSGSADNVLKTWEVKTGRLLRSMKGNSELREDSGLLEQMLAFFVGPQGPILACAFVEDGRHVAAVSGDKTLRLWEVRTGLEITQRTARLRLAWTRVRYFLQLHLCWSLVFAVGGFLYAGFAALIGELFDSSDPDSWRFLMNEGRLMAFIAGSFLSWFGTAKTVSKGVVSTEASAFSRDGTRVLQGLLSSNIVLRNTLRHRRILSLGRQRRGIRAFVLQLLRPGSELNLTSCAISADYAQLVTGTTDGTLKIWDGGRGTLLRTLTGHCSTITACAFSTDGTLIISGAQDATLMLWDVKTGNSLASLYGYGAQITACLFAENGRQILSSSADGTVKMWDVSTRREVSSPTAHQKTVTSCAFSPDGKLFVSASADATLKVWESDTGTEVHTLTGHRGGVNACVFAPDGANILSAADDWSARVWDATTGEEQRVVTGRVRAWIRSIPHLGELMLREGWSGARMGAYLCLACFLVVPLAALMVALFDWQAVHFKDFDFLGYGWMLTVGTLACAALFGVLGAGVGVVDWVRRMNGAVTSCAYSPDGTRLAFGAVGGAVVAGECDGARLKLVAWHESSELKPSLQNGVVMYEEEVRPASVLFCTFTPDGKHVLSVSRGRGLNNMVLSNIDAHSRTQELIGYIRGRIGSFAETLQTERLIRRPDMSRGPVMKTLRFANEYLAWLFFDPFVIPAAPELSDGCIQFLGHRAHVTAAAFSPNGKALVSADEAGTAKAWVAETGEELRVTAPQRSVEITACSVSPDGSRMIWARADGTIDWLDLRTLPGSTTVLTGHTDKVTACAWSPDGLWCVSVSADRTVKLWDGETHQLTCEFCGSGPLTTVTWSPNGKTLAVGEHGGRVLLLQPQGLTVGPLVVTPWQPPAAEQVAVGCPLCRQWTVLPPSVVGTELDCSHCHERIVVNPFVIRADWRPIETAWKGGRNDFATENERVTSHR